VLTRLVSYFSPNRSDSLSRLSLRERQAMQLASAQEMYQRCDDEVRLIATPGAFYLGLNDGGWTQADRPDRHGTS
jgi:hypothetical protein